MPNKKAIAFFLPLTGALFVDYIFCTDLIYWFLVIQNIAPMAEAVIVFVVIVAVAVVEKRKYRVYILILDIS